jgi:hypothetical protein
MGAMDRGVSPLRARQKKEPQPGSWGAKSREWKRPMNGTIRLLPER